MRKMYVLICSDETLYTGITTDIERRLYEHNNTDKGAKYTKARRPVQIIYTENADNRSDATKKEMAFKKLKREEKIKKINFIKK